MFTFLLFYKEKASGISGGFFFNYIRKGTFVIIMCFLTVGQQYIQNNIKLLLLISLANNTSLIINTEKISQ